MLTVLFKMNTVLRMLTVTVSYYAELHFIHNDAVLSFH